MYDCAEGELGTALSTCMKGTGINSHISTAVSTTNSRASSGEVDPVNYLASHKVYMYSGTADTTVYPAVMDALETYYESFIDSSQIYFEDKIDSAHTQPTTDAQMNKCTVSKSPYISYCNYDGAGEAFKQIYGDLNPRNNGTLSSSVQSFSQDNYLSNPNSKSIADTGYIYIPEACSLGESCRVCIYFILFNFFVFFLHKLIFNFVLSFMLHFMVASKIMEMLVMLILKMLVIIIGLIQIILLSYIHKQLLVVLIQVMQMHVGIGGDIITILKLMILNLDIK